MTAKSVARTLLRFVALVGINPFRAVDLKNVPRYLRDRKEYERQGGKIDVTFPVLVDYTESSGSASGHYFHQDLLVSQFVFARNPEKHADIASRIDGFVAHVAAFRSIDVLDIRPLTVNAHPNINFVQADLMSELVDLKGAYDSVSCLHALEHFGLGRYSDPISVNGHLDGFRSIASLVKPGGTLYISFPVGRRRVEFNAHRVFDPSDVLTWMGDEFSLTRFDYVNDTGDLFKERDISEAANLNYGCGIYTLTKAA